jgi:katanin p60 ATPase-containing subunit A1
LISDNNQEKDFDKTKPFSLSGQLTVTSSADNKSGFKLEELRQGLLDLKHDNKIIDIICNEILTINLGISFNDIAALEEPKRILNETVILPFLLPEFFTGMRQPWNGILLFGPPGTGKTLLAKAIASMNHFVFFNCSTASLISKWRGDSEKLIKCLFDAARIASPSILFFDEIDSLVSSRSSGDNEHEASRRMKTEIFSQIDGIQNSLTSSSSSSSTSMPSNKRVLVLATTNCPWDLDTAMLRRLEKRIYIPLPDEIGRKKHFELCFSSMNINYGIGNSSVSSSSLLEGNVDETEEQEDPKEKFVDWITAKTEGYSGSDIVILCREASMIPMRKLLSSHSMNEIQKKRDEGKLEVPPVS